jgi:hypothetical protein
MHGGKAKGAPKGNSHAFKHGSYTAEHLAERRHFADLLREMKGFGARRHPEAAGRWASFWYLVQEGPVEDDRLPDLRRCERIRWVRWVIENAGTHAEIGEWQEVRGTQIDTLLWYREEYLVVLAQRQGYWLLKTAYCTTQRGRIEKKRRERDAYLAQNKKGP